MKKCIKCKISKSLEGFHSHPGYKDGLRTRCRSCVNEQRKIRYKKNPEPFNKYSRSYYAKNADKCRSWAKQYRKDNPLIYKNYRLKECYGITIDDYQNILDSQNGCCAICKSDRAKSYKFFAVDHCHSTGKIRGLLCEGCNTGIGLFKDNPEFLRVAADYLESAKIYALAGGGL